MNSVSQVSGKFHFPRAKFWDETQRAVSQRPRPLDYRGKPLQEWSQGSRIPIVSGLSCFVTL